MTYRGSHLIGVFAFSSLLAVSAAADPDPDASLTPVSEPESNGAHITFTRAVGGFTPRIITRETAVTYAQFKEQAADDELLDNFLNELFEQEGIQDMFPQGEPSDDTIIQVAPYNTAYMLGSIGSPDRLCTIYPEGMIPSNGLHFPDIDTQSQGVVIILHTGQDDSGYYSTTIFYDGRGDNLECTLRSSRNSSENTRELDADSTHSEDARLDNDNIFVPGKF